MRKLRLSLEHLAVQTFTTERPGANARGTVHARQETYNETCAGYTCVYVETCMHWQTCYMDCSMDCTFRWEC